MSSDTLGTTAATRSPISRSAPAITSTGSSAGRLRFSPADSLNFAVAGGTPAPRVVYMPDVQVQLVRAGTVVFSGMTDLGGELSLPDLDPGTYEVKCSTDPGAPAGNCGPLVADAPTAYSFVVTAGGIVTVRAVVPPLPSARNLRIYGHVALNDGSVCGTQSEFFAVQSAATVQILQSDMTPVGSPRRVNRFGDYAVDAAALAQGQYQLKITCEGYASDPDGARLRPDRPATRVRRSSCRIRFPMPDP